MTLEQENTQFWCLGYPCIGTRKLEAAELADLKAGLRAQRWRQRVTGWLAWAGLLLVLAGVVAGVCSQVQGGQPGQQWATLGLALAIFGPGLAGSLLEVLAAYSRKSSVAFGISLLAFILGILMGWGLLAGAAALVILFGGWGALLLRALDGRKLKPLLKKAGKDLEQGEVLGFGPPNPGGRSVFEMLPCSALKYQGRQSFSAWQPLVLASIAPLPQEIPLTPSAAPASAASGPGREFYERELTEAERVELAAHAKRIWKGAPLQLLGVLFFAAMAVRLLENIINRAFNPGLSQRAWLLVGLAGLYWLGRRLSFWRGLRRDLKAGKVKVVRAHPLSPQAGQSMEYLPGSKLLFYKNGVPARWRRG